MKNNRMKFWSFSFAIVSMNFLSCASEEKPEIGMLLAPELSVGWGGEFPRGSEYPSDVIFDDNEKLVQARAGGGDWGAVVTIKVGGKQIIKSDKGGNVYIGFKMSEFIGKEITAELKSGSLRTNLYFSVKGVDYENHSEYIMMKDIVVAEELNNEKRLSIGVLKRP